MVSPDRSIQTHETEAEIVAGLLERKFPDGFSVYVGYDLALELLQNEGELKDSSMPSFVSFFKEVERSKNTLPLPAKRDGKDLRNFLSGGHGHLMFGSIVTLQAFMWGRGIVFLYEGEPERENEDTFVFKKENLRQVNQVSKERVEALVPEIRRSIKDREEEHLAHLRREDPSLELGRDAYLRGSWHISDSLAEIVPSLINEEASQVLKDYAYQA